MVLAELGGNISRALKKMTESSIIDETVLNECLKEISNSLIRSDVQFKFVREMQTNIKKIVNFDEIAAGLNKRKIIQHAIFNELVRLLDPGKPCFAPKRSKPSVVMFVGLQGAGKTTTCTKYAHYHQKKGWKPALVCADTFRAGAFDQLKQNATKAKIPFYGSYMEADPVKIAADGVERFKKENCDLIIVDTSGRHKQEASLFEEMRQISEVTKPDLVIFVMDSSIGQAAFDQAEAFKKSVAVGAVIITKMDGHAKGGGALSAVAATKSPVIFIGTGEHMHEFEEFDVKPFVSQLLGLGNLSGFVNKIKDILPMDTQQSEEMVGQLSKGQFTLRIFYEQLQIVLKMGSFSQIVSMLPGFSSDLMPKGREKEFQAKYTRYMIMMDSMTNQELDSRDLNLMNESRIMRIARGSGSSVEQVRELFKEYKRFSKLYKNAKQIGNKGNGISKMIPPGMLGPMGGMSGLQNIMKQMGVALPKS
ncbi:signal-recognition-particle GTPase [Ranunculus cassubicifolius]